MAGHSPGKAEKAIAAPFALPLNINDLKAQLPVVLSTVVHTPGRNVEAADLPPLPKLEEGPLVVLQGLQGTLNPQPNPQESHPVPSGPPGAALASGFPLRRARKGERDWPTAQAVRTNQTKQPCPADGGTGFSL